MKVEILGSVVRDCSICKASNVTILHFRDEKDNRYQCCKSCFDLKFVGIDINRVYGSFWSDLNRKTKKPKKIPEIVLFNKWFKENIEYADADAKRLLKMGWYARAKLENKK